MYIVDKIISEEEFADRLLRQGRPSWTREGAGVLYRMLESFQEDLGEPLAFDLEELQEEWCEFETAAEALKERDRALYEHIAQKVSEHSLEAVAEEIIRSWGVVFIAPNSHVIVQMI